MSTHNIGFYEEISEIITYLSSNIIEYAPYFFCCMTPPQHTNYGGIATISVHSIVKILFSYKPSKISSFNIT